MSGISWWRTSFGEAEAEMLRNAVFNEHISQGPLTLKLEAEISKALDVPYAIATTSGSVALVMALMALGVGRDDEVIVPNRTWVATAHAAMLLGARVVLVDVLPDRPVMDVSRLREKITARTKAIMPVHLNGRAVNMEQVNSIAKEFGLHVVEDACQAIFSRNSEGFLGTQSEIGCFSLGVTKLISTGQGGVLVTRNENVYEQLKLLRNHGVVDNFTDRWNQIGCNFKFTDLLAAFGLAQMQKVPQRIDHVKMVYERYVDGLKGLSFVRPIPVALTSGEIPLFMEVLCEQRDSLMGFLAGRDIQVRPSLPSLNSSAYFESPDAFPCSDRFARDALFLPCGPDQPLENVEKVISQLYAYERQR